MEFKKSVVILGTKYKIIRKSREDLLPHKCLGYTAYYSKEICIPLINTFSYYKEKYSEAEIDEIEKHILRHELIHAFINESGLYAETNNTKAGWARNEEMVDFFAMQIPKITKVFQELNII